MKTELIILSMCAILTACNQNQSRSETEDPYLWLEDIEGERSLEWIKARNTESDKVIKSQPLYDSLRSRYLEAFNEKDKIAYPQMVGDYVYNLWEDEKNERGLWRRMPVKDYIAGKKDWETVLDLDELSLKENKKWVYKGADWLKPDNRFCLISLSDGGKDESEIREFDAVSKKFVENGFYLEESKGGAGWIDKNTLLISTDFGPGTLTTSGYPRIAKIWKRGTPVTEAQKIFERDSSVAGVFPMTYYVDNRQYTFIYVWVTAFQTEVYLMTDDGINQIEYPIDADLSGLYRNNIIIALQSDWKRGDRTYPAGSLVSFDIDANLRNDFEVSTIYVPDDRSSYVSMSSSKDFIVVNTMQNVQNKLLKCRMIGNQWEQEELDAPDFGSIFLISSSQQSNDYFFQYSNFITPSSLIYGSADGTEVIKTNKPFFNTDDLTVDQFEATSKDGTKIPYFMVHKKDLKLDGKNPTLIYAYGGFNSSEQPYYSTTVGIGWLEQGGIYVLANIRGGGEFGPEWHKAAMREKRQNAYDDFYAVTGDLIDRKITSHEYLGAFGWSNGGLLAGVVLTQHPEMYNAVVVGAPLLDMKRYSKMLAGASWIGEYGDPDNPDDWAFLKKYSPYQNVRKDVTYPEALFITSIKDDRVHPGHARKMAAKMLEMGHPVLYHETIEGGHGAASTNAQQAEMWAMVYTYLNMKLNTFKNQEK